MRTVEPQRPEFRITSLPGQRGESAVFQASLTAKGIRVRRTHVFQRGSPAMPRPGAILP